MRNILTFVIGLLLVTFSIFCGLIYIEIIIVSEDLNIWIVGDLKQDFKTSMVSDGADQIHLN